MKGQVLCKGVQREDGILCVQLHRLRCIHSHLAIVGIQNIYCLTSGPFRILNLYPIQ